MAPLIKNSSNRYLASLALAAAAAATFAAAAPQSAAQEDAPYPFGDVVDVELVNVEVWVTDRKGRPITGLAPEDFEVLEDGKPVEITHFSEVSGSYLAGAGTPAPLPETAPAPAAAAEVDESGHMVIYFDELHLGLQGRKRIVEDVKRFVASESVAPERVMILRQSSGLFTEAAFGSTRDQIEGALDRLAEPAGSGIGPDLEKALAVRELQQLWDETRNSRGDPCLTYPRLAMQQIDVYALTRGARIAATLDHLTDVASFLAAVPGVKTLVYVADTLETTPGYDLRFFIDAVCPPGARQDTLLEVPVDLAEPFRQLTRHANANRVTFYALQAHGLRPSPLSSADQPSLAVRPGDTFDIQLRTSDQEGLSFLAVQTGGRAIFNRNRFAGELQDISRDMSSYYSLAYVPPHGGDRGEHKIKVRVDREKTRVRHRHGYRDKGPDERMAERLESALFLGLTANPLEVRLGAGALGEGGGGKYALPLHVLVPAEKVVFLPHDGGDTAQLKVQVVARADGNRIVSFEQKLYQVERPAGERDVLDFIVDLELGEGEHVVAVGVRDEASRETSYVATNLAVAPEGGSADRS